jgi:hypothetical protein
MGKKKDEYSRIYNDDGSESDDNLDNWPYLQERSSESLEWEENEKRKFREGSECAYIKENEDTISCPDCNEGQIIFKNGHYCCDSCGTVFSKKDLEDYVGGPIAHMTL